MATVVDNADILKGEDRLCTFSFPAPMPTGASTWNYALKITQTKGGNPLITKTFGPSDYNAGDEEWTFTVAAASTTLLTFGLVTYAKIWRTDTGYEKPVSKEYVLTVGR